VERAARNNDLMPLHALVLRFPSTADRFSLGYDESVSAIDYLVRTYGQDALVALIQGYAGGVADDDAFQAALGVDVTGFEAGWLADLGVDEPAPYGPKPAPPGPLPPGWNAAPQPTGPPVATPPPPGSDLPGDDTGLGTTLVIGVGVLFAIVVLLGILVVARGLNRGDPLLPPVGVAAAPTGAREAELPTDLAALDARLAPPPDPGEVAPADDDDTLGERP
jgi:hypothetical protein